MNARNKTHSKAFIEAKEKIEKIFLEYGKPSTREDGDRATIE